MKMHSNWPTLATQPGTLGNPVSRLPTGLRNARPTRRASRLVRAWHAAHGAWLTRRLARVEAELRVLKARLASPGGSGQPELSREDLSAMEGCCMELATLRARIERCRALG